MKSRFEGGCLCGEVRYKASTEPVLTVHCCCKDCQKIGGTAHATHSVVPAEAFQIMGKTKIYEKIADSGNLIVRRFCPLCGSALYHTRQGLEGQVVIRTSTLDEPENLTPEKVIYVSSAVSWDCFNPDLPKFEYMS